MKRFIINSKLHLCLGVLIIIRGQLILAQSIENDCLTKPSATYLESRDEFTDKLHIDFENWLLKNKGQTVQRHVLRILVDTGERSKDDLEVIYKNLRLADTIVYKSKFWQQIEKSDSALKTHIDLLNPIKYVSHNPIQAHPKLMEIVKSTFLNNKNTLHEINIALFQDPFIINWKKELLVKYGTGDFEFFFLPGPRSATGGTINFTDIYLNGGIHSIPTVIGGYLGELVLNKNSTYIEWLNNRFSANLSNRIAGTLVHENAHAFIAGGHQDGNSTKRAGRWPIILSDSTHFNDINSECMTTNSIASTLWYINQPFANCDGPISSRVNKINLKIQWQNKLHEFTVPFGGEVIWHFNGEKYLSYQLDTMTLNGKTLSAKKMALYNIWFNYYRHIGLSVSNSENVLNKSAIIISPNPSKNIITINTHIHAALRIKSIALYNVKGKKMAILSHQNTDLVKVDVSSYPAGVYIATVNTDKGVVNKRFLVVE